MATSAQPNNDHLGQNVGNQLTLPDGPPAPPARLNHSGVNSSHAPGISTPSMRRADLVSVGRTHAHQNLVSNTEFTLTYESIILMYLTTCVYFMNLSPDFSARCQLDPRLHTIHFIMLVLWPTVVARLFIYVKMRNANYTSMQNSLFFLNAFYNITYGAWTIYNIVKITQLPNSSQCKSNGTSLLELNYEVVIIFGVFPALITCFFATIGLFCAPYIAYLVYQNRQHENSRLNRTKNMISRLMRTKYDSNVFQTQESCMICLIDFDEDSLVTPLPCDIRHYFHTTCIEQWLMVNASCPLCKSPVTLQEIERVAQMYQHKLNLHDKCCSEHNFSEKSEKNQNFVNEALSSSYKSGTASKTCPSHYAVGSHFYNQTLLNSGDENSESRRSTGSHRLINTRSAKMARLDSGQLEMSMQPSSQLKVIEQINSQ